MSKKNICLNNSLLNSFARFIFLRWQLYDFNFVLLQKNVATLWMQKEI